MAAAREPRVLSHVEARDFYNSFGARQDLQAFYERPATDELIAHADFDRARSVYELGSGTGRFAEELLAYYLVDEARYIGVDLSSTMVNLATHRLERFGSKAEIRLADGVEEEKLEDRSIDRFVSNYVLDLLSADDTRLVLSRAHRLLRPEGLLCLVSLTDGGNWVSGLVTRAWKSIHSLRPGLVGGCRPLNLRSYVEGNSWRIVHHTVVTSYLVPSEVLIAAPNH